MAPPQYTPLSVQQGQRYPVYFGNGQMSQPGMERPLTYQEFLASRGQGQGNFQTQKPAEIDYSKLISKAGDEAEDVLAPTVGTGVADAAGASTTFAGGQVVAGEVIGSAPGGGYIMSTGAIVPASVGTPIASGGATAATSGAFDLAGIGSAGNAILPAAGAVGALDLFANKRHGGRGAAQGALSGAAIGSYGGPVGAGIGALVGAGAGYFGNFGDKDRFQGEYKRAQALRDKGVNWGFNATKPTQGRSKEQLIAEAQQNGGNVKFAGSRNEGDLTGVDLVGYSALPEKLGADYANAGLDKQTLAAQAILDAKAAREHHGTIDVNWNPELEAKVRSILGGTSKTPPVKISGPTPQNTSNIVLRDTQSMPQPFMIPRSKTKSPGVGMDGKPVPTWRR